MSERITGTIRIGWCIRDDKSAGVPDGTGDITQAQTAAICDRLEEVLHGCLPTQSWVDVWVDGEGAEPIRVYFEAMGDDEIEIDDGPINGTLADLRG